MSSPQFSQGSKKLSFHPRRSWPASLPAIQHGSWVIAGDEQGVVIQLDAQKVSLAQALLDCYPDLRLGELARLAKTDALTTEEWHKLLGALGFRPSERLRQILTQLSMCPLSFQNHVDDKALSANDLAILNSFQNLDPLQPTFAAIVAKRPTKSQTQQILELAGELLLMEVTLPDPHTLSCEEWLMTLQEQRRPQAASRDHSQQQKMYSWPLKSQARWVRRGDMSGFEIRLFATTSEELEKQARQLIKVSEQLKQEEPHVHPL